MVGSYLVRAWQTQRAPTQPARGCSVVYGGEFAQKTLMKLLNIKIYDEGLFGGGTREWIVFIEIRLAGGVL